MKAIKSYISASIILVVFFLATPFKAAFAQAELMPSGNLEGIRIKGQLMPFSTNLTVVGSSWAKIKFTGKELQKPKFQREGNIETVRTNIDSLYFTETVTDEGTGKITVSVRLDVKKDTIVKGIYFSVRLPNTYKGGTGIIKSVNRQSSLQSVAGYQTTYGNEIAYVKGVQQFNLKLFEPAVILRNDTNKRYIQLYLTVAAGALKKGDVFDKTYTITVKGRVDQSPAVITVNAAKKGSEFAGLGGNFRLQNPKTDPQVIDYCLDNMRVAWGRVEMPWGTWHPELNNDPTEAANSGKLNKHVKKSMEMAQRLGKMNIPVIVSAWSPPAWAVEGTLKYGPGPDSVWGNPLKKAVMPMIYKSIADYIVYLKEHYGVEAKYFSFNESDLGINVRQTADEHAELIKGLGAYLESRELKTKLLLGDNSDANTYKFIYAAMNDAQARPYIGAVSFHSWRGWETETLQKWGDAAKKLGVPLLVGEGSIDAAAWVYPAYFEEQSYALEEINLYTRLLNITQPLSILQWQLTADYSPLKGGGIFGNDGPLMPTQRFWQLKQLASTPQGMYHRPVTSSNKEVTCAALADASGTMFTFHIVNNGAERQVTLKGLPAGTKELCVIITDKNNNMKQLKPLKVINKQVVFKLKARCYTTLVNQ
jgi:hypothetical protein